MANTFKYIRWSGHWFPTDDLDANNPKFLSFEFFRSLILTLTIPLQVIPCIIDLVLKIPDMPKVIMNAISTLYGIQTFCRVIFIGVMRKDIWNIFKEFDNFQVPASFRLLRDQNGQNAASKAFKTSNTLFLGIFCVAQFTGCLFTVAPFVMSYEARIQKLKLLALNGTIPHVLVYEAWYPFDISRFPVYQLTIIFQSFCGCVWINMTSTSDAIFLAIIIREAEEFNVLHNMLVILSNVKTHRVKERSAQTIRNNLVRHSSCTEWPEDPNILLISWIEHHQLVLRILVEIRKTFSVFVFIVVGCNALSLVLLAYIGATIKDVTALLSMISFLFVVTAQLLSFSWYTVKLTTRAEEMSQELLRINWWEAPVSYKMSSKFASLRALKTVSISGMGYFDLNLEMFLSHISQFYILGAEKTDNTADV
ncbi:odorant receptor coreceptor-like [Neodiprion lecontei]|uniref:Odorant receptor n=1 Tax=Neodiprion lecontei TaxID=441921 RepID=A0ABM3GNX0_NEOLC|nr:odorant receptor coreceptor-like [Neodiprion lecontei]